MSLHIASQDRALPFITHQSNIGRDCNSASWNLEQRSNDRVTSKKIKKKASSAGFSDERSSFRSRSLPCTSAQKYCQHSKWHMVAKSHKQSIGSEIVLYQDVLNDEQVNHTSHVPTYPVLPSICKSCFYCFVRQHLNESRAEAVVHALEHRYRLFIDFHTALHMTPHHRASYLASSVEDWAPLLLALLLTLRMLCWLARRSSPSLQPSPCRLACACRPQSLRLTRTSPWSCPFPTLPFECIDGSVALAMGALSTPAGNLPSRSRLTRLLSGSPAASEPAMELHRPLSWKVSEYCLRGDIDM